MTTTPLDIALDYAARGIAVFPRRAGARLYAGPYTSKVYAMAYSKESA